MTPSACRTLAGTNENAVTEERWPKNGQKKAKKAKREIREVIESRHLDKQES